MRRTRETVGVDRLRGTVARLIDVQMVRNSQSAPEMPCPLFHKRRAGPSTTSTQ
jgi:hypothetical protein